MKQPTYKAKPVDGSMLSYYESSGLDISDIADADGFVYGNFVKPNMIIGDVVDFDEDYFVPGFWCIVQLDTLELVEDLA